MISEIYQPIDEASKESLAKIQALVESDTFLAGLGKSCDKYTVPESFPMLKDIDRSVYLLCSRDMWEVPEESRLEQVYSDAAGAPVNTSSRYKGEERKRRNAALKDTLDPIYDYLEKRLATIVDNHNIIEHLSAVNANGLGTEQIEKTVKDVYLVVTASHIYNLVQGAYFDGFHTWPVANHIYECYLTGGITAGWIGPLEQEGGVPQECMQLLHFGPETKS